ncbi:TetR/AcrR family transcriptional regulator [Nocardia brasiliensis]|uniref:TetR family transcriptional regulator n=1 Tax=Nocardia brasiliensis (strain ATCC 700358 / HUJEG-1) TaxID=1133849 RepID=K0ETV4_NOCB7|nr:TetR/AcrR family transcriptional regulator C-terminal ligand-binding domain-containing protein [Nocardia brasiliensis]AFU00902.1 TetR family transcriptional regulator [Nocardia brasiliensis ATCC 700358]OCF84133.1 TetR family transcriptional regulator [Nocardia brasiliensis]
MPPSPADSSPRSRPGGRTARIRDQVLDAVRAELTEHGYDALTVDTVAARAGVHRTTVYRRWRDVAGLITDVFAAASDLDWHPRDTGTLHGDLTALNQEIQDSLTEESSIAEALIAVSFRSAAAADALQRLWEGRYTQSEIVVERAVRRGELEPGIDARALLIAATAPLYHQLILLRTPPDPGLPAHAAATAALAARAGAFTGTEGAAAKPRRRPASRTD